jgi:predicted amidophosphoribosyltransferase
MKIIIINILQYNYLSKIINSFIYFFSFSLNLFKKIFPLINVFGMCIHCYEIILDNYLCIACWKQLKFLNHNRCGVCNVLVGSNICIGCNLNIKSIFVYNAIISNLILKLKYGKKYYISKFFIQLLGLFYNNKNNNLIIMYIPHYGYKQLKTSINTSLLLAYEFQNQYGGRIIHNILQKQNQLRQRDTKNYKERIDNGFKGYTINPDKKDLLKNKDILLIDDILTTGGTIISCGNLIKGCLPRRLDIFTISKVTA